MKQGEKDASEQSLVRPRWPVAVGAGLALAVLAAAIAWSAVRLREQIRAQIAGRDGESLDAVAMMQYLDEKASEETLTSLEDPGEQIQLVLKISRLRNVLGVRLFSPAGEFVNAFPAYITESSLAAADLSRLRAHKPVSHFYPRARWEEQDLLAETNGVPVPLLEVNVPLREAEDSRLAGVAQFLLNGSSIAQEYAQLDRRLAFQSVTAFGIGGSVLAAGLGLAFQRLNRANRLLARRTKDLLQANQELALAAKTSAVGALTSHLIHGLKNPLSGLHSFVQDHASGNGSADKDWQLAVQTTERMSGLINRVVQALQESESGIAYEVPLVTLAEMLTGRMTPFARAKGVQLEASVSAAGAFSNRETDLILFILENLVQNALQATAPAKTVRFRIFDENGHIVMEVQDEGSGLPPDMEARLFTPCVSSKPGGGGIGLAISQQLARHLGAVVELKCASAKGCTFRLTLAPPKLEEQAISIVKPEECEPTTTGMSS